MKRIKRRCRKAIFLDRDGTVTEEVGYVNHPDRLKLIPGAAEAIKKINDSGMMAILITNQAGVAKGYFPEWMVHRVHEKLESLLRERGARLDRIYYCPHHPEGREKTYKIICACRKPAPGMIHMAEKELNIDVAKSYVIGDKYMDVELARKVGATGIMVLTGYGKGEYELFGNAWKLKPDHISQDLSEAVDWILSREKELGEG